MFRERSREASQRARGRVDLLKEDLPILGRVGTRANPSAFRKVFFEDVFSSGFDGLLDAEEP